MGRTTRTTTSATGEAQLLGRRPPRLAHQPISSGSGPRCVLGVDVDVQSPELLRRFAGGVEEGAVETGDRALPAFAVARVLQIAPAFRGAHETASADQNKRPLGAASVVLLRCVAEVDDLRAVEHGSVTLGNRAELFSDARDLLDVKRANPPACLDRRHAVDRLRVAEAVNVLRNPESAVGDIEGVGANGDDVRKPGDERRGRDVEVRLQPIGLDLRAVLVGDFWCALANFCFEAFQPAPSILESFERCKVLLELFAVGAARLAL